MRSSSQTPNSTHANATTICEMAFKAMALKAERARDYRDGYDFMIEGKVRVACRFAMPTSDRQQSYRKRNGEVSTYTYKRWTFNFHRHGRITERYCDFFVCFLGQPPSGNGHGSGTTDVNVFVIPWESITGLTFCSSLREGSTRGYRGRYSVYQDAWHLIDKAAGGNRRTARKTLRVSADGRRRLKLIVGGEAGQGAAKKKGGAMALRPKSATARTKPAKPARGSRRNVIQLRAD